MQRSSFPLLVVLVSLAGCSIYQREFIGTRQDGTPGVPVRIEYAGVRSVARGRLSMQVERPMRALSQDPGSDSAAGDAARAIEEYYRSQGFPDVRVQHTTRVARAPDGRPRAVAVRFAVSEGPRVFLDSLEIAGNRSIESASLLQLWPLQPSGAFGLGKPLYVRAELARLVQAIGAHYQAEGYVRVRVRSPRIDRWRNDAVRVRIELEEGPLFRIRKVDLAAEMAAPLAPRLPEDLAGKPFSTRILARYLGELRAGLREVGRADPRIHVQPLADPDAAAVDIVIRGDPGKPVRIGETAVRGNDRTKADAILSKLALATGDLFRGSLEDAAIRELQATGLFQEVRAVHEPMGDDEIRLVIEVVELKRPPLSLRVGYGSWEKARGALRLEQDNFLGSGYDVTAQGKLHTKGYDAEADVADPDLFGSDIRATLAGGLTRSEMPSFTDRHWRTGLGLARELAPDLDARIAYRFEDHDGSLSQIQDPTARIVEFDQGLLSAELDWDTRDTPLFPRSGQRQTFRLDFADDALGGDVEFLRATADSAFFWPALDRLTLAFRGRIGLLWPGDGSAQIPPQVRFYSGGQTSVRSFREAGLGPTDGNGEPLGGEFTNLLTIEARYLAFRPVEFALFADAGNLGRRVEAWGFSDMRYAIGASLLYQPPIPFPTRFDVAWNPDRRAGEEAWVLHLLVGEEF